MASAYHKHIVCMCYHQLRQDFAQKILARPWTWSALGLLDAPVFEGTPSKVFGSHPRLLQQLPHQLKLMLHVLPRVAACLSASLQIQVFWNQNCILFIITSSWTASALLYPCNSRKQKLHIIHHKSMAYATKYLSFWSHKYNWAFKCNFEEWL